MPAALLMAQKTARAALRLVRQTGSSPRGIHGHSYLVNMPLIIPVITVVTAVVQTGMERQATVRPPVQSHYQALMCKLTKAARRRDSRQLAVASPQAVI
jgi:hypothetical protein